MIGGCVKFDGEIFVLANRITEIFEHKKRKENKIKHILKINTNK